jgi:isoquinoline 1-oxidoreductase beta subunit
VRLAAEKSGWNGSLPKGRGRGLAYHHSFNTRIALVAEIDARSTFNVDRIVAAQVEGAIGFALSAALHNQVTLSEGVVEQSNFDDYEPTRMREIPKVEVDIVGLSAAPSGIGEPVVPPIAPAIGNAIFAATGKRLRSLPFDLKTLA